MTSNDESRGAWLWRRSSGQLWLPGLVLFLASAGVYSVTAAHGVLSGDVVTANLASYRIATTGAPWLDGMDLPGLDDNPLRHVWITDAKGHEVVARSPGVIAVGVPAYWISQPDGMTLLPGTLTAAALTAGAVLFLFQCLRKYMVAKQAALAAIIFGFTTPVWSVAANGVWPHTVTVLGISAMAWAASRERWWLVGLFGGIALWGRLHTAIIVAVVGLALGVRQRQPGLTASVAISSMLMLGLSSAWGHWMYGSWDPRSPYMTTPYGDYAASHPLDVVNHLGFWVSPDRGILVWSPLILVLLPALFRAWKGLPDWSRWLLLGGLSYTLVQATLNRFSGGDTFYGYRLGLELLACAAPALALSADHMGRHARRMFVPIAVLQFTMIAPGAAIDAFVVRADMVWERNAFVNVLSSPPGLVLVVGALGTGILFARIWQDPGLTRKPAQETPTTSQTSK